MTYAPFTANFRHTHAHARRHRFAGGFAPRRLHAIANGVTWQRVPQPVVAGFFRFYFLFTATLVPPLAVRPSVQPVLVHRGVFRHGTRRSSIIDNYRCCYCGARPDTSEVQSDAKRRAPVSALTRRETAAVNNRPADRERPSTFAGSPPSGHATAPRDFLRRDLHSAGVARSCDRDDRLPNVPHRRSKLECRGETPEDSFVACRRERRKVEENKSRRRTDKDNTS